MRLCKKEVYTMSERTKMAIASEFCAIARSSRPNCESSLDAQDFFKQHLMGMSAEQMAQSAGQRSSEERRRIQASYFDGMEKVLKSLTGAEFQTAASYDTIMNMIPKNEHCIRCNLRKIAIEFGIYEPAGWGGK